MFDEVDELVKQELAELFCEKFDQKQQQHLSKLLTELLPKPEALLSFA